MNFSATGVQEYPWRIPDGWAWTTMGDVSQVVGGGTPATSDLTNFDGGSIPWITPADLSGYSDKYIAGGARNITQKGLECSGARLMPAGTVLFSSRAPIGYVAIASRPMSTNQGFKSFVLNEGLDPDYVYHYLKRAKELALDLASGTTFLEISGAKAAQIAIPIAPHDEQRRIVAEIEKQFSRLDAAVAALKRAQANLCRYRASVLKAACEGQLVPQDPNDEPATKLIERVLSERQATSKLPLLTGTRITGRTRDAELPTLPPGWVWARWEQVGSSQNGRAFPSSEYRSAGVRLLRPGNLHANGRVVWTDENTRYMPERWEEENPQFVVGPNELVINLTAQSLRDAFLGRVCMTGPEDRCLLNQRIARLTPVGLDRKYLLWMFKSEVFRKFVNSLNAGSLIQHMFTSQLAHFRLPVPPLPEQHRIVAEVERRLSVVDELETAVEANLKRAERLRQAILKRAFEGRLVPQDPADEPATVLLERIRAQRIAPDAGSPAGRPRRRAKPRVRKTAAVQYSQSMPEESAP